MKMGSNISVSKGGVEMFMQQLTWDPYDHTRFTRRVAFFFVI